MSIPRLFVVFVAVLAVAQANPQCEEDIATIDQCFDDGFKHQRLHCERSHRKMPKPDAKVCKNKVKAVKALSGCKYNCRPVVGDPGCASQPYGGTPFQDKYYMAIESTRDGEELYFKTVQVAYTRGPLSGLRFRLSTTDTHSGWAWDVQNIRVTDLSENRLKVTNQFDSGSVYYDDTILYETYHVSSAFKDNSYWWGGRKDTVADLFYLGGNIPAATGYKISFVQYGVHITDGPILFQIEDPIALDWNTLAEVKLDDLGFAGQGRVCFISLA